MGCGDACPVIPGERYLHWRLENQADKGVAAVRPLRDEIESHVLSLVAELLGSP